MRTYESEPQSDPTLDERETTTRVKTDPSLFGIAYVKTSGTTSDEAQTIAIARPARATAMHDAPTDPGGPPGHTTSPRQPPLPLLEDALDAAGPPRAVLVAYDGEDAIAFDAPTDPGEPSGGTTDPGRPPLAALDAALDAFGGRPPVLVVHHRRETRGEDAASFHAPPRRLPKAKIEVPAEPVIVHESSPQKVVETPVMFRERTRTAPLPTPGPYGAQLPAASIDSRAPRVAATTAPMLRAAPPVVAGGAPALPSESPSARTEQTTNPGELRRRRLARRKVQWIVLAVGGVIAAVAAAALLWPRADAPAPAPSRAAQESVSPAIGTSPVAAPNGRPITTVAPVASAPPAPEPPPASAQPVPAALPVESARPLSRAASPSSTAPRTAPPPIRPAPVAPPPPATTASSRSEPKHEPPPKNDGPGTLL